MSIVEDDVRILDYCEGRKGRVKFVYCIQFPESIIVPLLGPEDVSGAVERDGDELV
jgi:hypothetical protein